MTDRVEITTPIGRLVSGDAYKGNTTDMDGNPLVVKSGANIGQPRTNFYIGVAIPKNPNVPWENEPWGMEIMRVARTVQNVFDQNGQLYQGRDFAFKVTDGDSQTPNRKQKRPCDQEGYQGCWVLNFSNGFAPKIYNSNGTAIITEPNAVKRGYYVQVLCTIGANSNANNPGVFLNHEIIALSGYGEEIHSGVDASQAGFGQQALPQGASPTPLAGMQQQNVYPGDTVTSQQVNNMVNGQQPVQQQQQMQPQPATDMVNPSPPSLQQPAPEVMYMFNGKAYTEQALLAMDGWTPAHIAGLQRV